jgi:hypothetical protein
MNTRRYPAVAYTWFSPAANHPFKATWNSILQDRRNVAKQLRSMSRFATLILLSLLLKPVPSWGQTTQPTCDPRLGLVKMTYVGITKFRWQEAKGVEGDKDPDQVREVHRVMRFGTKAVPMLIACLAETRDTRQPLWDFWGQTPVNVVAFRILSDLFTDRMSRATLEGTTTWNDLQFEAHDQIPMWEAWGNYIDKHGEKYMQLVWLKAWTANKSRIYWDDSDPCFKVKGTQ